jgi:ParB-like chromosome segregation protein Spo0J
VTAAIKIAFERETIKVPLADILPTKTLADAVKRSSTYKTLEASYPVVGIIEPPLVCRQPDGTYLLLDGHARLAVAKAAGATELDCLVSLADEAYSHRGHVSELSPIQANRMILRALDAGVPDERLAKALNRSAKTIRMSRTMLKDICPEALELLKDKPVSTASFALFKNVKPIRQIEMAELMNKVTNYGKGYAAGLVSTTKADLLAERPQVKRRPKPKAEDLLQMEAEMQTVERDILRIDETYGRDVINLTVARGYVTKLLENAKVVKYLASKHPDVLTEFQRIHEAESLET